MKQAHPKSDRGSLFYRVCGRIVQGVGITYFGWTVYHPDRVPRVGPVLLAANHVSFADPPLIGAAVPRPIHYLARQTLFQHPAFSRLIRSLNAVPLDRDGGSAAGLRTVLDLFAANQVVLLFPEGTRSTDGRIQETPSGLGLMVLRSGTPVVPVRTFGLGELWGRSQALPRPGRIVIKFGQPMRFERQHAELATASRPRVRELYEEVTREVMDSLRRLEPCRDRTTFG